MEEEFKPTFCTICLNVKSDENCRAIDAAVKNALDTLQLKPVREIPMEEVINCKICTACCTKVFEAFQFKAACRRTEDRIFPYVNLKSGALIDLREIYLKEKGEEQLRRVLENKKICRLCLQIVTSEPTFVKDIDIDIIRIYIPEVNFNSTKEPVVCTACLEALKTHSSFLRNCLTVQKFENVCEDEAPVRQFDIKMEEIEIKSEESNEDIETPLIEDEPVDCRSSGEDAPKTQPIKTRKYKCHDCSYQTDQKRHFARHQLQHKNITEVLTYRCGTCPFQTKYKENLRYHTLIHTEISKLEMYKCDVCDFETKYKGSLSSHKLSKHKTASETRMYNCDMCSYETKFSSYLLRHQIKHKNMSEVRVYTCDLCDFVTKRKMSLTKHQLLHKDRSEIQMYTCDVCSFETVHKQNLAHHQLIHNETSKTELYKCEACSYKTKRHGYLLKHQLTHKDASQVRMYKCNSCDYVTKRRGSLASHQLVHRDVSEVQMYKCDRCSYETKRKGNLRCHLLKHRSVSVV